MATVTGTGEEQMGTVYICWRNILYSQRGTK